MRILVTGAAGRLGGRLVQVLSSQHDVTGIDIAELDITDFAAVRAFIGDVKPEIVLHPAAWTDVDGCAREPEKALGINGYGAHNVAVAAAQIDAAILYVSSNEVFEGTARQPYSEYDPTHPTNPYAYSKWYGEQAVMRVNPRHYVVRIAWLFAHGGKNFLQTILSAAQQNKVLRVVTDEVANPTYNNDAAEAMARLIETRRYGIYHLTNAGMCSRYAFARYVLDQAGYIDTPIQPITSREWRRLSQPPAYTGLWNFAGAALGITLRPWQEAVQAFLQQEGLYTPSDAH